MIRPTTTFWARCAVPVAALVSGVLVWHASGAAFSSSTANEGNRLSAGEVVVSDDDTGSASFTTANMKPGQVVSRCIRVTSTSSVPTTVKLYLRNVTSTRNMIRSSQLAVEEIDGDGGFGGCGTMRSGTLLFNEYLPTAVDRSGFESGAGTWAPSTPGASQQYRVFYGLHSNAPNSVQGGTISMDLVWEARSD